ncbi:HAMP domain-containing protein [Streptococcus sp. zg-86]|uniref:histidine kinase n=1 Tax=Streptococcus zhangguiae TaxID=2664091 RepID=A0A6I4RFM5_9STRE|nr:MULTISPECIES: HAMP domain-containing sensor histidine kinase [unclassified Streptococcus]MTB64596.1 HAMP domain-containing protein [Streptococcus sp. zg-86]MTB90906.1 HAMP domain-containing protein [Streptococcus sp. zg-36]MWV56670.1 sensor histidine kinase [Streptococcus sp. zg-70]QTH48628.1 HAMP domain-containing histidine kinase [Streptococcus sp. zg-86]
MKLKYFILIGYLTSTLIIFLSLMWAVNRMLIPEKGEIFILLTTLVASLVGAFVSLMLMSRVFTSLEKLTKHIEGISQNHFETIDDIQSPIEFQEFAQTLNTMTSKLEDSFQSLEISEKEKNTMIAQLSHDIKTPITSIQATVEGMLDGLILENERDYYLKTIRRQTDRLNKLVESLNNVTLNALEREEGPLQAIFIDKLLIDTLSEFQLKLDQEGREVDIQVEPASAKIISDYDKLLRILVNLVSNALKYSPSGSPLQIHAVLTDDQLKITVEDQGQGIPKEELHKIFKLLYRVESSRNMNTGGYGLGLYIAQELAHQLNGQITVQSELGQGSAFSLTLRTRE